MSIVNVWNEWDPLEEVILGTVEGACFPSWNIINKETIPPFAQDCLNEMHERAGKPFPAEVIRAADEALNEFSNILKAEGVKIVRPQSVDYSTGFSTPNWSVSNGYCAANPRDVFLIIGNEIIESPMPDRGRYHETDAYRPLLMRYFQQGARWTAAPKPRLVDPQYDLTYKAPDAEEPMRYVVTELEPVFDAADFIRCGKDLFVQKSHVTNEAGIVWMRRHLGAAFQIHVVETRCRQPMHIDTTLMPLAPGKMLVNPDFIDVDKLPNILRKWDMLIAPRPNKKLITSSELQVVSDWMSMNVLMLDERRVVVEREEEPMIAALKNWGFEPIPCSFSAYYPFAGSFHCATLDVRRNGGLQSYF